jgi:putative spermidine/putrescine transport system permease protein
VTTALHSFDTTLERAANSMGATPFTTFRKVLLPLIRPGIFNGSILAFITSFDEIVITLFLAGARPTLPKKMYDGIQLQVSPTLTAVATIFIVTSAALLVSAALMRRIAPGRASNEA